MKYVLKTFLLFSLARVCAGQPVGDCEHGNAEAFLDVNNVRAAIYNNGNLFWSGPSRGNTYAVPKQEDIDALFGANIWIAGRVDGELRLNATDYGPWTFWPGPLDDSEHPPENCAEFDRIYHIDRKSLLAFDQNGDARRNLTAWPADLGAPVVDGDGISGNYNLHGGDRPALVGDQMLWWVMNDRGNRAYRHPDADTSAATVGLEVHGTAFAFRNAPVLDSPLADFINQVLMHTTFYRYRLKYQGTKPLEQAWFGLWMDPSLGNAADNFVGSDSVLGLGYAYNGDDFDDGSTGYGDRPAAVGADFLKGPEILPDGIDNDLDGAIDEDGERSGMKVFWLYHKGVFDPRKPAQTFRAIQGFWPDGSPMIRGGSGGGPFSWFTNGPRTTYMYSGNPPAFWSEDRLTEEGHRSTPSNRRIVMSAGPFRMEPGGTEEVVIGFFWARGRDRLDSVYRLKSADAAIQSVLNELLQPRLPQRDVADPATYTMVQNHPNPFANRTTITYELPKQEHVWLAVFDALGRRVALLVDGTRSAGVHRVQFAADDLSPGVYFYFLRAGLVSGARWMVIAP